MLPTRKQNSHLPGLALTLLLCGLSGLVWLIGGDWAGWLPAMQGVDEGLMQAMQRGVAPAWLPLVQRWSDLHRPRGILLATGMAALLLTWRRDWPSMWMLLLAVPGGSGLNHLLKQALARPRPGEMEYLHRLSDFSLPSGHAASATLLYGALTIWLLPRLRSRWLCALSIVAAMSLALSVALSRVVLGAHRPTDVLAGIIVGLMWLMFCAAIWRCLKAPGPGSRR